MSKRIYLASPFFNEYELEQVRRAEELLAARGFEVFSPRQNEVREDMNKNPDRWSRLTFENDRVNIDRCDIVVMLYHGQYSDSGTAWECGYAYGLGKPVVAVHAGKADCASNLMIHESCRANITMDELGQYDFDSLPPKRYSGKIF